MLILRNFLFWLFHKMVYPLHLCRDVDTFLFSMIPR